METFYKFTITSYIEQEDGKAQKEKQTILTNAVNYTDAEAQAIEYIKGLNTLQTKIDSIVSTKINLAHNKEGDYMFEVVVGLTTVDEKEKTKVSKQTDIIGAENLQEALDMINKEYHEDEYHVIGIKESVISVVL